MANTNLNEEQQEQIEQVDQVETGEIGNEEASENTEELTTSEIAKTSVENNQDVKEGRRKAKKGQASWASSHSVKEEQETFSKKLQQNLIKLQRYKSAFIITIVAIVVILLGYLVFSIIKNDKVAEKQNIFISAFFDAVEKYSQEEDKTLRNIIKYGDSSADEISVTDLDDARKKSINQLNAFIGQNIEIPETVFAKLQLGALYYKNKDFDKSITTFQQVSNNTSSEFKPFTQLALINIGLCKMELANNAFSDGKKDIGYATYNEALTYFNQAKGLVAGKVPAPFAFFAQYYDGMTNFIVANLQKEDNKIDEAKGSLNRAIEAWTQLLSSEELNSKDINVFLKDTIKINLKQTDFLAIKLGMKKIMEPVQQQAVQSQQQGQPQQQQVNNAQTQGQVLPQNPPVNK